jgi:hypothetical protein
MNDQENQDPVGLWLINDDVTSNLKTPHVAAKVEAWVSQQRGTGISHRLAGDAVQESLSDGQAAALFRNVASDLAK